MGLIVPLNLALNTGAQVVSWFRYASRPQAAGLRLAKAVYLNQLTCAASPPSQ